MGGMHSYRMTTWACYISYIVQAIIINLPPLLFSTFARLYGISNVQMGLLILLIFVVQIVIDLLSAPLARLLGYRGTVLFGHGCSLVGLVLMSVLPQTLGFPGLVLALVPASVGSGVVEVLISPIIQYIPDESVKSGAMSLLHSFYCWGMVLVIALSTGLFHLIGESRWFLLPLFWIPVPLVAFLLFLAVPIAPVAGDKKGGMGLSGLLKSPVFWVLMVMMPLGSASELAMSQWASYFAEMGLGVPKELGDLLGPCMFALCQGLCRLWYSGQKSLSIEKMIVACAFLGALGFLTASGAREPMLALAGCAMVGFAAGCFWPGTFSLAADFLPMGGTLLYGLLAFAGDFGCGSGPQIVAWAPSVREGLSHAAIIPMLLALCVLVLRRLRSKAGQASRLSQD